MGFRQARIRAGLSVREVMTEMGVTDAAVYMWETGVTRPRTSILVKLARLYHCSVDELLIDNPGQSQNKAKA
jgi:putative transcriptional regulator